jgi:PmbA protein
MHPMQKERLTLENAAAKLLAFALKAGAENAEVCATYGVKTKISLEKQDYHMASSDDGFQLGCRVMVGQRQGFASCNTTDSKELKETATRAVEIANFSPENQYYTISASENIPREAPSDLWDDALYNLSLQTQKDWTKILADEALKDARFRLNEGSVGISAGIYLVINSQGTHKIEHETAVSWGLMGMAVEDQKITSFDYFQNISRVAAGVPDKILASTRAFKDTVIANLKQGPTKSYKGLVIFTPRAVIDILVSGIAHHLNGRNVVEGTSKWKIDHIGERILNQQITVKDMPWLSDRNGCATFDREGNPTKPNSVVENGQLKGFFLDSYAGQALRRPSTGNASGGPGTVPSVSPHCMCISGGTEPISDLLHRTSREQVEFLMVSRFSGRTDPITGDFSGVAKGGEWWRGGERAHYVQETLISGNMFEALGPGLFGISRETQIVDSSEESPTLIISNVSVTGG